MLLVQWLVKMDRKALYGLANCYLRPALGLQHAYLRIILTVPISILDTLIVSSKLSLGARKCF